MIRDLALLSLARFQPGAVARVAAPAVLGFFDDDDLCVRARRAGYDLLVAQNVFIHHFGSRTFTGLGVDPPCPRGPSRPAWLAG